MRPEPVHNLAETATGGRDLETRSAEIGTGLLIPVLTRFLAANRYPLRSKTL
jgi:hypothetical protein